MTSHSLHFLLPLHQYNVHHHSYSYANYRHFEVFTNNTFTPMPSTISSKTSFLHFYSITIPIDSPHLTLQFSFSHPILTTASTQQSHIHSIQSIINPSSHSYHPKSILSSHLQTTCSLPFHYLPIYTNALPHSHFHYYFYEPSSTHHKLPLPRNIHTYTNHSTNTHTNPFLSIPTTHFQFSMTTLSTYFHLFQLSSLHIFNP